MPMHNPGHPIEIVPFAQSTCFSSTQAPSDKKNRVRHSVEDHHEGKSHDKSDDRAQDRQEQGILDEVFAERICKARVVPDDDLQ